MKHFECCECPLVYLPMLSPHRLCSEGLCPPIPGPPSRFIQGARLGDGSSTKLHFIPVATTEDSATLHPKHNKEGSVHRFIKLIYLKNRHMWFQMFSFLFFFLLKLYYSCNNGDYNAVSLLQV
ncbi:Hypothetical predicted protein [Podarcis lilfordi]|uniref:Uncharacterized protein n=1 Tax=Podarcis lilfordi TaxID=74358 RepID=A0AA35KYM5_9SAUR|nr:Hypothetical predicted protein [Podarcis lilfordi]